MIRKVLVAIDGSENAERALDFAEKYNAALTVLNVSESPALGAIPQEPTAYTSVSMVVFAKDLRHFHEEILSRAVARASQVKPNLTVSSKLREGNPALEIVAEAKEGAFDAVVLGHVGTGRVKEILGLGGISERVVHLTPCPVIIVR